MFRDIAVTYDTVSMLMPEILLVLAAVWIFVSGTVANTRGVMPWIALMGIGTAAIGLWLESDLAIVLYPNGGGRLEGPIGFDLFGYCIRCLALVVGLMFVAMTIGTDRRGPEPELLGSLMLVIAGLMLVAVSTDLVLMFLGLELISIPTYILLFLARRNAGSDEATLKYFFLSILASALMLYGFSFLYGVTGSLRLEVIQFSWLVSAHADAMSPMFVPLALLLIVAGLGFKIAVVPFHFYAPDVYQGTTNTNAGLLAVIPKIAGIVALVRIAIAVLPVAADYSWQVLLVLSILTMTLGNVVALWQKNVRRLLAYSSIAHAGYLLIGLAIWVVARDGGGPAARSLSTAGLSATMLYLAFYVAASVGTFAALVFLGREGKPIDTIDQLTGIAKTHRIAAFAVAIFMFSFAGIPPLAGFWGKFSLFTSALTVPEGSTTWLGMSPKGWFLLLAIVGAVNAAISAAYYLRVVAVMYFGAADGVHVAGRSAGAGFAMSFAAMLVVTLGLYPGPLIETVANTLPSESISLPLGLETRVEGQELRPEQGSQAVAGSATATRIVSERPQIQLPY